MWVNISDSHVTVGGHSDKKCNDRRGQYRIANRPEHERRWLRAEPGNGLKTKDLAGIPWRLSSRSRKMGGMAALTPSSSRSGSARVPVAMRWSYSG